jgi:hypothetical protein
MRPAVPSKRAPKRERLGPSLACAATVTNRVLEILSTSSYIPLVFRRTRITQHTATLIGNIFTNDIETIESSTNGIFSGNDATESYNGFSDVFSTVYEKSM